MRCRRSTCECAHSNRGTYAQRQSLLNEFSKALTFSSGNHINFILKSIWVTCSTIQTRVLASLHLVSNDHICKHFEYTISMIYFDFDCFTLPDLASPAENMNNIVVGWATRCALTNEPIRLSIFRRVSNLNHGYNQCEPLHCFVHIFIKTSESGIV